MAEFASKGVAGAGLGLGIAGTALGLLAGGLGNVGLGNYCGGRTMVSDVTSAANTALCLGDHYVTQKEMQYIQELNAERNKNAILTSEQNTEVKIADVYERLITRINADRRDQDAWNASQSVINAQVSSAITTNTNSIAGLNATVNSITKTAVPTSALCNFGCGCSPCGCTNGCGNNI